MIDTNIDLNLNLSLRHVPLPETVMNLEQEQLIEYLAQQIVANPADYLKYTVLADCEYESIQAIELNYPDGHKTLIIND